MKRISPTVVEIDLDALRFNFGQLRKKIPAGTKTLCVVKSNAYGHGAQRIARVLQEEGADFFGTGTVDEGIDLREAGIKRPILLLLGIIDDHLKSVLRYQLTPVIYDISTAGRLQEFVISSKKPFPIHVKLDTGMTRLGVPFKDFISFCDRLKNFPLLEPAGLLTHLADADHDEFTTRQERIFLSACKEFQRRFPGTKFLHMANSLASIMGRTGGEGPDFMARFGIALYGAYPAEKSKKLAELKPILSWKTRIAVLKKVPAKTPVSYGRTFYTKKESLIGVIPVGYADGYPRTLSNQGRALVHGKSADQVGTICMDMMMLDLTSVPNVKVGDEVVLIGRQGKEEIFVEELAKKAHTISYEIFCRIADRIPRVYL